ncbi:YugN family protein [Bacillus sp. REN3]|uniref:YugN family protein n=1 Tax=Bacillus sp. REN3 TaxID=2802440 RepID=UPI001AED3C82|nr:YugN family protein [Bacillus sp. REN3]
MIQIPSSIDGKQYSIGDMKQKLEPIGFTVGDNWEYDHGYFDYKMNDHHGDQQYVRIPVQSTGGASDDDGTLVQVGTPFILDHQFKTDVDEEGNISNFSASVNQFKEPADKDAPIPEGFVDHGKSLVEKAEQALNDH